MKTKTKLLRKIAKKYVVKLKKFKTRKAKPWKGSAVPAWFYDTGIEPVTMFTLLADNWRKYGKDNI